MQKNNPDEKRPIEVDTVSGEYYVRIPEWILAESKKYG